VANALGPSFESALVVKSGIQPGDGGQGRTLPGSLLFVPGSLALLDCRPARTGPAPVRHFLRSLSAPAPTGPRAPPVLRLP
jgi:hypothetical protein